MVARSDKLISILPWWILYIFLLHGGIMVYHGILTVSWLLLLFVQVEVS